MNQTTFILSSVVLVMLAINVGFYYIDATVTDYNVKIDQVIGEGLKECSSLVNDNCISVISTLDQICQVAYFPNCFGPMWSNFVNYKQALINNGHLPEYQDDQYYTLNNDHYGNDGVN